MIEIEFSGSRHVMLTEEIRFRAMWSIGNRVNGDVILADVDLGFSAALSFDGRPGMDGTGGNRDSISVSVAVLDFTCVDGDSILWTEFGDACERLVDCDASPECK
jgi:hypothetical protein